MKTIMKNCHVMTPPTSASCNSRCTYCFKAQPCPNGMDIDDVTLQLFIRQQIDTQETGDVIFTWQGNEPTLDRFNFFKRVIELQQQFAQGKNIINTLLIDGILLDDSWCELFKKNQFLISIAVDDDISLQDSVCKTTSGKPLYHLIEEAVRLLQKHDLEFSTRTVINAMNSQNPLRLYHYLKNLGSRHMQFIPLLEPLTQGGVDARSLTPAALGTFLKTLFYSWVRLDIGTIKIPIFEHAFAAWCGLPAPTCAFALFGDSVFASKINDDLYECDCLVNPKTLLSNNHQPVITTMLKSTENQIIEQNKPLLVAECMSCKVKFACHGGCPKDRVVLSERGIPELNYYCESYQVFFTYIEPYMLMMIALWEQNYAPSDIRQYLS
ncbi:radical SAM protein [Citrobacter sp. Cy230]|uniref:radical SAM/SPASM domain-containing protein n=1 Tax=Citrobacter sp. Cy230 TaxID=2985163 RepID=UPI00336BE762